MNHSDQLDKIAPALVKLGARLGNPAFDSTNPFFQSEYVSLAGLIDHCREPLAELGLTIRQFPVGVGGVETIILHESGQWMSEIAVFATTPKDPQAAVAAVSYGRRSGYAAIAAIAGEPDDDGNQASGRESPATKPAPAPAVKAPSAAPAVKGGPSGTFTVLEVTHKDGTNAKGNPWRLSTIRFSDGAEARTFDKALAGLAVAAAENGAAVTREIVKGKFGFDLLDLKVIPAPEQIPHGDNTDLPF